MRNSMPCDAMSFCSEFGMSSAELQTGALTENAAARVRDKDILAAGAHSFGDCGSRLIREPA
jgi:hypothetical protein